MKQQDIWNKEHQSPQILQQMDSKDPSSGVVLFWDWVQKKTPFHLQSLRGIEIGCGKGRNAIWLAQNGVEMTGLDFSEVAILEAKKRMKEKAVHVDFSMCDVTTTALPDLLSSFDFAIDCFASTDIDTSAGRSAARDHLMAWLKPGGILLVYTLSEEDEYHQQMRLRSPAAERNAFLHPETGKFEKVFDNDELFEFYNDFSLLEHQRVKKQVVFNDVRYLCLHHWLVLQKQEE